MARLLEKTRSHFCRISQEMPEISPVFNICAENCFWLSFRLTNGGQIAKIQIVMLSDIGL